MQLPMSPQLPYGYTQGQCRVLSSWLIFKPGKWRNISRLIPIPFSHLVLCSRSLPGLRRSPVWLSVGSSLCQPVSSFIPGAIPAPSSPLIPGPEEQTDLGNVLSSPPPPPPPPQRPSALSPCGADGAWRSKPQPSFFSSGWNVRCLLRCCCCPGSLQRSP